MDGGSWHCTEGRDQDHPHGKEMQKSKTALWGGLTNSCEKKKRQKQRYSHLNAEFQRIARRDKKAFLSNQCKEREENNRMGKTGDLFKKITLQKSWNVNIKVSIPHCLDHIGTSFVYCPIFRWKHTTKFKSALIPVAYFLPVNKCSECRCCTVCAPLKVAKEGQWGHFPSCYFWVSPTSPWWGCINPIKVKYHLWSNNILQTLSKKRNTL